MGIYSMGLKINEVSKVSSTNEVLEYLVPCSVGDGTAKAITIRNIMKVCADILGITAIEDFSPAKQYRPATSVRSRDCYCIYENKLYRFIKSHLGVWNIADVEETNLYQELLNFYGQEYEEVKVVVSVADEGFSVQGIEVSMVMNDGTVEQQITDSNGIVVFRADKGMAYTIKVSDRSGYQHIPERHFTAFVNAREIPVVYNPDNASIATEAVSVLPFVYGDNGYAFLSGTKITVDVDGHTEQYIFDDASHSWHFSVPHGKQYIINYPEIATYRHPEPLMETASLMQRVIVSDMFAYVGTDEVFLCYKDEFGTWQEASISTFDRKYQNAVEYYHINTVALRNTSSARSQGAKCDFYVPVSISTASKKWRATNVRFASLPVISAANNAKIDFDGYTNCALIENELAQASEIQDANYVLPYLRTRDVDSGVNNNIGRAFCVSLGQFWELIQQYASYVSACTLAGRESIAIKTGYVWSSSQYSDTTMWYMYNGSPNNGYSKTNSITVFPAYAF